MATGRLKRFQHSYGFILEDAGQEVFFHISSSPALRGQEKALVEGSRVDFDKRPSNKKGKEGTFEAFNVRFLAASNTSQAQTTSQESQPTVSHFYNPYTFVPTPPRGHLSSDQFAGDYDPVTHGLTHTWLEPALWSGRLPIKLTTVTPLLLTDVGDKERTTTRHQTYDMLDALAESSLRGMLRSAYEIVTNSRYAGFRNSDRLAYRMETDEAIKLIPAMIESGENPDELVARLYLGTSQATQGGPAAKLMYAAMLTLYGHSTPKSICWKNPQTGTVYTPKTGDEVWAEIVLCQHEVSPRYKTHWDKDFQFWKVVHVWPKPLHPAQPALTNGKPWLTSKPTPNDRRQSFYAPVDSVNPLRKLVSGYAFITNENMGNKHDERIFFGPTSETFSVTDLQKPWQMRIQSYREAHREDELFRRRRQDGSEAKAWEKIGPTPGKTAWSPHIYQDGDNTDRWCRPVHDARSLQIGDMVYARCTFTAQGTIKEIKDLFPVMISRELYDESPEALLDPSLQPANQRTKLSPADRLFGWVAQRPDVTGEAAYKGRLRVVCDDGARPDIVHRFVNKALPLAILGQPKPAQGRFYVAKDADGTPHDNGGQKRNKGYRQGYALRGRKQYWHHTGLEAEQAQEYWQPEAVDWDQQRNGRYQEYRRPNDIEDSQNRSITGWIQPSTVFHATLHVQNLQSEEVGALLWLLSLPAKHYCRLGYGKPLGFGSVRLEIDRERLVEGQLPMGTGKDWQRYYSSLDTVGPATLDDQQQQVCIRAFQVSMVAAYSPPADKVPRDGSKRVLSLADLDPAQFAAASEDRSSPVMQFTNLPFIKGFLQVLQGPQDGGPIHYPRMQLKPDPEGENFRWFSSNERGSGQALPSVTATGGLPYKLDGRA